MRFAAVLVMLTVGLSMPVSATPPQDPGLERAKKAFDQKMKQVDEQAARDREKAMANLREEYEAVINRKRKAGDDDAVAFFTQEANELLGEDGSDGVEAFQKLRRGVPLANLNPLRFQGEVSFLHEWDKVVPAVEGRLTKEPFLYSPFDAISEWPVPKGAKTFEAYGHVIKSYAHDSQDCIMEVRVDGRPAAKSAPLNNANRTHKFVVVLPRGARTITLVTDPNKGGRDGDLAVWVEPYFYDR